MNLKILLCGQGFSLTLTECKGYNSEDGIWSVWEPQGMLWVGYILEPVQVEPKLSSYGSRMELSRPAEPFQVATAG